MSLCLYTVVIHIITIGTVTKQLQLQAEIAAPALTLT